SRCSAEAAAEAGSAAAATPGAGSSAAEAAAAAPRPRRDQANVASAPADTPAAKSRNSMGAPCIARRKSRRGGRDSRQRLEPVQRLQRLPGREFVGIERGQRLQRCRTRHEQAELLRLV